MRMGLNVLSCIETTQKKIKVLTVNHLVFLDNGFAHYVYFQFMKPLIKRY